jgi:hypothetical protein
MQRMATDGQLAMVHLIEKFRNENPFPGLSALLEQPHTKVSIDWPAYLGLSEAEILAELECWRLERIARAADEMADCPGEISQKAAQLTRAFGEADAGRQWAAAFARQTWEAARLQHLP